MLLTIVLTGNSFQYLRHRKKEYLFASLLFVFLIIESGIVALSEFSLSFEKLYETSDLLYICMYFNYFIIIMIGRTIVGYAYDDPFTFKEKLMAVLIPVVVIIVDTFISYEWLDIVIYSLFYFSIIYLCYRYYLNNRPSSKKTLWLLGSIVVIACIGIIEVVEYYVSYQETAEIITSQVTLDYRNLSFDLIKLILSVVAIKKIFSSFDSTDSKLNIDEQVKLLTEEYELTNRQEEIVKLIVKGHSNKDIAELLFITEGTVKTHIHNIFKKVDISNRNQLLTKIMDKSGL